MYIRYTLQSAISQHWTDPVASANNALENELGILLILFYTILNCICNWLSWCIVETIALETNKDGGWTRRMQEWTLCAFYTPRSNLWWSIPWRAERSQHRLAIISSLRWRLCFRLLTVSRWSAEPLVQFLPPSLLATLLTNVQYIHSATHRPTQLGSTICPPPFNVHLNWAVCYSAHVLQPSPWLISCLDVSTMSHLHESTRYMHIYVYYIYVSYTFLIHFVVQI